MSRWLLALGIAVIPLPCAQAHEAAQVIDACLERLDPAADVGYARVSARCPELPAALAQGPIAAWLPADWNHPDNQLSAAGLAELRVLLRQVPTHTQRPAPRVAPVAALLATLVQSERAHSSWWDRFRQWLRRLLAPQPAQDENWLERLLAKAFTSDAADTLIWSSLALIVLLALGILVNELRLAGILAPAGGSRRQRSGRLAGAQGTGLEQVARAPLAEQPRLLLEFIASRLAEEQRLPPARALTTGELTQRARLPQEQRARLAELAAVAERVRFSGCEVPGASLADAVAKGRTLLTSLDLPPAAVARAS